MDINSASTYPYPIWGLPDNFNCEDPEGVLHKNVNNIDDNSIHIEYEVLSHNKGIDDLIEKGYAAYQFIVESKSVYRLITQTQKSPYFSVSFPSYDVNRQIVCKVYIVAIKDITGCTSLDVNEVYEGIVDYPKGAVIADIDKITIQLDAKEDKNDLSKIFTTQAADVKHVEYSLSAGRVIIKYPKELAKKFDFVESHTPYFIESSFVFPAMIFALSELHRYSNDDNKDWVFYLKQMIETYYYENDSDCPEDYKFDNIQDVYDIARYIIKDIQIDALEEVNSFIDEQLTQES